MIAAEAPKNILSDDTIVENLKSEGIEIARRTVAKYRESLNIPSSIQRRRIAQSEIR
jgi:RNA polymerase sigma-54 factor